MKKAVVLLVFLLSFGSSFAQKGEVLNNGNIIAMHQAKVSGSLITQKINSSKGNFDMSVPGLLALKSAKVPEGIIEVMLNVTKPTDVIQNESVIQLVQGGFSKKLIIQKIQAGPNRFNVTTDGLIQLQVAKVPDSITKVMINGNGAKAK